ncbi:MAG: molybdopterin-dependent oxidoreductase [Thermoanaerobaculia bacterium]|nr:molybdopterin-dependent oxidoreductase [Thermoanaerobaculia bacterium]
MKFNVTRRDVLRFAGGAAIGTALSPMPWNLTDDLAIWTQNWSWIPKPPKGERATRTTVCALCPAGCPVEARCIGGLPVALRAANDGAALCPLGMTGHHLPHHPNRLTGAVGITRGERRPAAVTTDMVVRETARAIRSARAGAGSVVVLDTRPGRSGSWAWRRLLAGIDSAVVAAAPGLEGASLASLDTMLDARSQSFGLDLRNARTILSFGAPVAEGWGQLDLAAARESVRLVQVEPMRSRTAESADRWLPARPGTEAAVALAIANVLLAEGLVDTTALSGTDEFDSYLSVIAGFSPDRAAAIAGLAPDEIFATARELASSGPSIVVAGEQPGGGPLGRPAETAIFGLNLLLGNVDREGGIVGRTPLPAPGDDAPLTPLARLDEIPDHSVALVIIDASAGDGVYPWSLVARKLSPKGSLVVALSPFLSGSAARANFAVPTPPYLETIHELPTSFAEPVASIALSAPLLPTRSGAVDPVAFMRSIARAAGLDLAGEWATTESLIRERVARIHRAGSGTVTSPADGSATLVAELSTSDELWDALLAGGRWSAAPSNTMPPRTMRITGGLGTALGELPTRATATPRPTGTLTLVPRATRDTSASAAVSPVLTKLYQESGLRGSTGTAVLNPRTAASLGFAAGRNVRLLTAAGAMRVALMLDEGVMPGVVEIVVAPERSALGEKTAPGARTVLDLLTPGNEQTWSAVDAQLLEG